MVESDGIKKSESEEIQKVMKRIDRNYDYYSTNPMIKGTFDFLKMVVYLQYSLFWFYCFLQ